MEWSFEELEEMVHEGIAIGICTECGAQHNVEPDAQGYDCFECGAEGTVTSPLVEAGFI